MINSFSGPNEIYSNFFAEPVRYNDVDYPTNEHAFQASKSILITEREDIALLPTPGQAKRAGRRVLLRNDWEQIKDGVMLDLVRLKFKNPKLRAQLLATGDEYIIEGNTWGDTYWGVCDGKGQNKLGKIIMQVRSEIRWEDKHESDN